MVGPPPSRHKPRSPARARGGGPHLRAPLAGRYLHPRVPLASERGDTLIEVLISALLVGLIVVGTLNGFDAVTRVSADQRHHNQAAVLAAQSQELLRTDSAATLDSLQITPHVYTSTVDGQTYTITQEAALVNDSKQTGGCNATSTSGASAKQNGNYFRIKSSVTWPQLKGANRKPVTQASIITPPDGSALEVDVTNGGSPEEDVAGVTVISNANGEEPLTTGTAGCVIYAGVPSTSASVEAYKVGDVTPSGAYKVSAKELTIAPNLTTHYPVTLAPGGAITAQFTYEGKTTYVPKNNAGATLPAEEVKGDTFVAYNSGIKVNPDFEVGSVAHAIGAGNVWEPLTSKYANTATTPIEANYPTGNLFPFSSSWAVYAGDCLNNNASTITKNAVNGSNGSTLVPTTGSVPVPLSRVTLNVYQGSGTNNKGVFAETSYSVAITNTNCKGIAPNNESPVNVKHIQKTTAGKELGGHLEDAFQPFGEYELCLYNEIPHEKTYKVSYTNNTVAGSTPVIYLGQLTEKEKTEQKKSKEKEEETAQKTKETEEKTKITQWKKEETEGKITHAQRTTKETTAKTARLNEEAATQTARETAETKETEEAKESKVTVASGQASC